MGSRQDKTAEEQHTELLEAAPASYLNESGSPAGGPVVCPRSWHVYGQKPPHVSAAAWASITPAVRLHHIRCLRSLKNMPTELLNVNIASAVLECVRRDAKQRQWSPSTMAKEYAAMAGALRDLPLYTTESRGVYLSEFPEWRAAQKTVKRLERETDTGGPAPITFTQYKKAVADLRRTSPKAALYLSMMWALAARAGDIGSLRAKDITLEMQPRQDGTHSLGIVQRFGKGTRFRGTYWPASTLAPEEASELRKLKAQRNPKQRLVSAAEDDLIRTQIRTALQRHNRESALPSVRKGAIRHLAAQGVSEETLMRLTGHKRVETLYRYIGHGLPITREAVAAQDSAAQVHHPAPSSSAPRRHQHSS
eukprot:gene7149-biopygen4654